MEFQEYQDTLAPRDAIDADLYCHVGHTPAQFLPNQCTACALRESLLQALRGEGKLLSCSHGYFLYRAEACPHGCT